MNNSDIKWNCKCGAELTLEHPCCQPCRDREEKERFAGFLLDAVKEVYEVMRNSTGTLSEVVHGIGSIIVKDRMRIEDLEESLRDIANQYAHHETLENGDESLTTGSMSALELAFQTLGWEEPHIIPKREK
jgi:hypothetical protein